jgi:hypothetical protein
MDSGEDWSGTAADLLVALGPHFGEKRPPSSPRALGGRLRKIAPRLGKVGITIDFERTGHNRDRVIKLAKSAHPKPATGAAIEPPVQGIPPIGRHPDCLIWRIDTRLDDVDEEPHKPERVFGPGLRGGIRSSRV